MSTSASSTAISVFLNSSQEGVDDDNNDNNPVNLGVLKDVGVSEKLFSYHSNCGRVLGRTMDSLVEFCSFQNGTVEPKFLEVLAVPLYENKETRKLEANQSLKVVGIGIIFTAIGITFLSLAILYHLTDKAIISIGDAFIFGIIIAVFLWITAFLTLAMVYRRWYRPPKHTFEYRLLDLENTEEEPEVALPAAATPRCYG